MNRFIILAAILISTTVFGLGQDSADPKVDETVELEVQGEDRYFTQVGAFPGQVRHFPSISIRPTYSRSWDNGHKSLIFKGFLRWDRDKSRRHWDIRDLYYQTVKSNWELSVGLKRVFWGVTESAHLVDIINQTDMVESFDGEEKLGQPMVELTWINQKIGTFTFYHLPYHRKRTFAGDRGRFRFREAIDNNAIGYESKVEEWRPDLAMRWKHYFGPVDIGFSQFYGSDREPIFIFSPEGKINAFYPVIHQSGMDLQITQGAILWKVETIYKTSDYQQVFAFVAGLEYTLSNVNGKGLDIGMICEYLYDDRDEWALSGMQNDMFAGSRFAFNDANDSSVLFGTVLDLENRSRMIAIEASRRIGANLSMEFEARILNNIEKNELILSNFRNDSFMKISLSKFF